VRKDLVTCQSLYDVKGEKRLGTNKCHSEARNRKLKLRPAAPVNRKKMHV